MSESKTEHVVQVKDAVESAAPPPSHVLLSLGGNDESFVDDDALLPLFDSVVGQIFWTSSNASRAGMLFGLGVKAIGTVTVLRGGGIAALADLEFAECATIAAAFATEPTETSLSVQISLLRGAWASIPSPFP